MQSEELNASLRERNIEVKSSLYTNSDHSLFQGYCRSLPATIRLQRIAPEAKAIEVEAEIEMLRSLQHLHVLKVLDCCNLSKEAESYVVIVMEHCASTGENEMESRRKGKKFLEEEKLWVLCISLIGAFSYLQRRGYAHRLISPSSLYISNNDWKVGNLTAATVAPSIVTLRCQKGHGNYHSPKVFTTLLKSQTLGTHNVYKSDVYSLGLTLLALARLEEPVVITNAGHLAEVISEEVGKCRYTDNFKEMLLAMLKTEEEERGDFVQFETWLGARPASLPAYSHEVKLQEKHPEPVPVDEKPASLEKPRDLPASLENPKPLDVENPDLEVPRPDSGKKSQPLPGGSSPQPKPSPHTASKGCCSLL